MIKLKMTFEFFEDVFKVQNRPTKITSGIPENVKLKDISITHDEGYPLVVATFDDGKEEETEATFTRIGF